MTAPVTPVTDEFRLIACAELRLSTTNPRKFVDKKALSDLTASVKAKGILVPILVRPQNGHFEIVAGERRYLAAKAAALSDLPCIVKSLTDEEALETQVIENLQRLDIHPLDECHGFQALMKRPGYDTAAIAAKIGKEITYVYRRLKLAALTPSAEKAYYTGSIELGHALLLARLQPDDQAQALKSCLEDFWVEGSNGHEGRVKGVKPVKYLERWIDGNILLDLNSAGFKKDDAELVPSAGPCTTCPKRTGVNTELFDDVTTKDRCTDPGCFRSKMERFFQLKIDELQAQYKKPPVKITYDFLRDDKGVLERHQWRQAKHINECPNVGPGIFVGKEYGQSILVCAEQKCKKHFQGGDTIDSGNSYAKGAAASRKREMIRQEIRHEIFRTVTAKAPKKLTNQLLRGYLLERLMDGMSFDQAQHISKALNLKAPMNAHGPGKDYRKALKQHYQCVSEEDLHSAIFMLTIGYDILHGSWNARSDMLMAATRYLKINTAAITRKIQEKHKAKKKQVKTSSKKKAAAAKVPVKGKVKAK